MDYVLCYLLLLDSRVMMSVVVVEEDNYVLPTSPSPTWWFVYVNVASWYCIESRFK